MAKNLDAIVPKYLLMQLLEESLENNDNQSNDNTQPRDNKSALMNLIEAQHEIKQDMLPNNFDLVDFFYDDSWPFD